MTTVLELPWCDNKTMMILKSERIYSVYLRGTVEVNESASNLCNWWTKTLLKRVCLSHLITRASSYWYWLPLYCNKVFVNFTVLLKTLTFCEFLLFLLLIHPRFPLSRPNLRLSNGPYRSAFSLWIPELFGISYESGLTARSTRSPLFSLRIHLSH